MAKQESRKVKRTRAAKARAREAHFRLVAEREGDPNFVQQSRTSTGRTIQLRPEEQAAIRAQLDAFVEKFGREPGPDDPLFFDPSKDEPTEMDPGELFSGMREAAIAAGVDLAYVDAWEELGYIVTEENRHLFTAHEVEEFGEAVARHVNSTGDSDAKRA